MADKILMAKQLRKAIQTYIQDTVKDESKMMEFADLYPSWEEILATKASYPAGTIFKYGNTADGEAQLWSFISEYTPQSIYSPDVDISHFKKIGFTEGTSYMLWTQPFGSTDCYQIGDIVSHKGQLWICTVANCVWEPSVFGWDEYTEESIEPEEPEEGGEEPVDPNPEQPGEGGEEEPETPVTEEYPEFVQPTGAHDSYHIGDIVSYNGKLYICTSDNNAYAPDVFGWKEYTPAE